MLQTQARGSSLSVEVRVNGQSTPIYNHNGHYFIEGAVGQPFSMVVTNLTNGRLEILSSVDGHDTLEARAADLHRNQGMVVRARGVWEVLGWRHGDSSVGQFVFTSPESSIAAQAGDASNVGVIGFAAYTERRPEPIFPVYRGDSPASFGGALRGGGGGDSILASKGAGAPDLGVGMGQTITDHVGRTTFERANPSQPAEVIEIHHRTRAWLEQHGVILDLPSAFPGATPVTTGYATFDRTR